MRNHPAHASPRRDLHDHAEVMLGWVLILLMVVGLVGMAVLLPYAAGWLA